MGGNVQHELSRASSVYLPLGPSPILLFNFCECTAGTAAEIRELIRYSCFVPVPRFIASQSVKTVTLLSCPESHLDRLAET